MASQVGSGEGTGALLQPRKREARGLLASGDGEDVGGEGAVRFREAVSRDLFREAVECGPEHAAIDVEPGVARDDEAEQDVGGHPRIGAAVP
ncbi:MAG: hypothetical protein ACE5O2_11945, partial [Armatimonadota bacterium]